MVFGGILRGRGGSRGAPRWRLLGRFTEDGEYIPHPDEVAGAEPLPQLLLDEGVVDLLSEEEYGWVLLNRETWRPRRPEGVHGSLLRDPVRVPGRDLPYDAIIWGADGSVYLADALTFALLRDSIGEKTASELVTEHFTGYVSRLPKDNPWRKALEEEGLENTSEDVREGILGALAAYYAQLAYLRKKGLLL